MKNQPWPELHFAIFMVGWFFFFLKKKSPRNHCEHGPPIVWSPKGVGLIAHLMAPFRPALLAGSWFLGFKMEKWMGSWGLSKKHGNLKIVVKPPRIFFLVVYLMYILYHYLAAENHSPIFSVRKVVASMGDCMGF